MTPWRHAAAVCAGYAALFGWVFAGPLFGSGYLAESDLYEFFLPVFLAPRTIWSSLEFGGMPAFADPGEAFWYPLHLFFARVAGSWDGFIVAAYIVAAAGAYAYVFALTRSRTAAAAAGLIYGLSEALLERVAHLGIVHTIAWLPLMLLAVDRLRTAAWRRWIGLGALVFGCAFVAGNPQVFLYSAYAVAAYALAGGVAERAGPRYYLAGLAMAALGAAIAMAQALPTLEASVYTARQSVNLGQFVSHANTPAQMLSLLIPAIEHEGREAPTYVGIVTLFFAAVAVPRLLVEWRVAFWLVAGVVALALGAGDATPLAGLAFDLPFYDRFRVGARHLILAAFAAAALAGIGIAAVQRGEAGRRTTAGAGAAVLLAIAGAAAAILVAPASFPLDASDGPVLQLPMLPGVVWGQLLVATVALAAGGMFVRRPASRLAVGLLLAAVAADLLLGSSYRLTARGLDYEVLPAAAAQPSVHARALRAQLNATHQRLLSPRGTHLDAVAPAVFARVWGLPIAGGYGPMLLGDYAALAGMEPNGSVNRDLLADHNAALDALAVRFVAIERAAFDAGPSIERHGLPWSAEPLDLPVGPPECGQRHPRHAVYAVRAGAPIARLAISARLRCSEDVVQGAEVGAITIAGLDGQQRIPLRAGIEIAEEGLRNPALQRRARHQPAPLLFDETGAVSYVTLLQLASPLAADVRLEIELSGTAGSMMIDRVTAIDVDGRAWPQAAATMLVGDRTRWRESRSFATSRRSDREADTDAGGEEAYVVLENLRARPRAWLTSEVLPLAARARDIALHYSLLPDGRRFDPAATALVDEGHSASRNAPARAEVAVARVADGAISVDVDSDRGGLLVLSETFYPGWAVRVDGAPRALLRVNGALQGVTIDAGRHRVEFAFAPASLWRGALLGGSAALLSLVVAIWPARRRRTG